MFLTSLCQTILWCLSAQGGCDRKMGTEAGFHHRKSVFTVFTTSSKSPVAKTQEPLRLQGRASAELSQAVTAVSFKWISESSNSAG